VNPRNFFSELKRRNVVRMAGLYLVGAWLLTQVASTVLPTFDVPSWALRGLIITLALGFCPALIFSWVFELTPQGLKRDEDVSPEQSIAPQTARRMDRMIIVVLALALGYFAFDKFVLAPRRETAQSHANSLPNASNSPANSKSIAVLPFKNLSDDKNTAYFSDGITEEILNALAQIPNLKVVARRSAFQFKGSDLDLRKIGQVLGVAHILEGSLQKAGDQVRINVQLVDAQNGLQSWSEKYDRKLDNVFAVEDEIAKAIATKLRVQLTGGGGQPLVVDSTNNPQAHELYLRGLTLLAARGPGLREAVDAFEEAVRLDPNYAQALGALAETYPLLPAYGLGSMELMLPLGESAAQKALRINPDTASAHVGLGLAETYRCHWPDADHAFRRALTLAPSDAEAVNQYAQFLGTVGQPELALREIERAQQLDPLSPIIGVIRTGMLMSLHRDDAATAQLESILAAHPDFGPAQGGAVLVYLDRKLYPKAEAAFLLLAKLGGETSDAKALVARGWVEPAQRAAAVQSLETAPENANLRADPLWYAFYLMSLGERSRALDQLEIYASKHNSSFGAFLWGRCFDPLRNDPRFKAILAKLALPYSPTVTEP
jgi:TolB-like protein/Tfp pilus assembly protein PilF